MIDLATAEAQAKTLRAAGEQSTLPTYRAFLKTLAGEWESTIRSLKAYDEEEADILPVAMLVGGMKIGTPDPMTVVRIISDKAGGSVPIQLLDEDGQVSWIEPSWRFSPVVVIKDV